jgi:hypothetical protein
LFISTFQHIPICTTVASAVISALGHLSDLLAITVYCRFLSASDLLSILHECLSFHGRALHHTSTPRRARGELHLLEATSHSTAKAASEEVVVIVEATAHHSEAAHASESTTKSSHFSVIRTSLLFSLWLLLSSSHHAHAAESTTEKVIVVVKEVGERILTAEGLSKYIFSVPEVEIAEATSVAKP